VVKSTETRNSNRILERFKFQFLFLLVSFRTISFAIYFQWFLSNLEPSSEIWSVRCLMFRKYSGTRYSILEMYIWYTRFRQDTVVLDDYALFSFLTARTEIRLPSISDIPVHTVSHVAPQHGVLIVTTDSVTSVQPLGLRISKKYGTYYKWLTVTSNFWQAIEKKDKKHLKKCWAHSPLRAAARTNFTLPFTRCRYCRTPPAHRCPRQRRQQQRQRVTEGTAMAP